jgi:hypothetical protein
VKVAVKFRQNPGDGKVEADSSKSSDNEKFYFKNVIKTKKQRSFCLINQGETTLFQIRKLVYSSTERLTLTFFNFLGWMPMAKRSLSQQSDIDV